MNPEQEPHPDQGERQSPPQAEPTPESTATDQERHNLGETALKAPTLTEAIPGVDWSAAQEFLSRNALRDAQEYAAFTPVVASAIANQRNAEIPFIPPTAEDIKRHRPEARMVGAILGFFSEN